MQKETSEELVKGWQPGGEEIHKRWVLANHPKALPKKDDFLLVEDLVPTPPPGKVLVRSLYLSVDPFQRLVMNATPRNVEIVPLYGVVLGDIVGEVVRSNNPNFHDGDLVNGVLGWQNYAITDTMGHYIHNRAGLRIIDESLGPIHTAASVLGRPGMTAYFSVLRECLPRIGDTMVVSTAAGAVGHLAGQIGKIMGAKVVGITSTSEKVKFIEELGFDDAINYKQVNNLASAVARACPKGVDIFYDNVGGNMADSVLKNLNAGGRVSHVGVTQHYNQLDNNGKPWHWKMDKQMFIVHDYVKEYENARRQISEWLKEGKLKYRDDIIEGLEHAPDAFIGLFSGENIGKRLVRINKERLDGQKA